jgi:C4-dicarboxylate transporter DctM subunit
MIALGSTLFVLLLVGVPIGISLAGSTAIMVLFDDFLSFSTLFDSGFFNFISKYTLIAIPFFIYAGFLMEKTGLVAGLFKFADALIGWVPGGFAYATLIAAVLFGAISGSSTARAAAMSSYQGSIGKPTRNPSNQSICKFKQSGYQTGLLH